MKKLLILTLIPALLLCGCASKKSEKRLLMDTVCTVTADCSTESLNGALDLCEKLDRLLSRHRPESEVSLLNHHDELEISKETLEVLVQAIYYCQKTGGKYDITITPASNLYDFYEEKAPTEEEAKKVLYKVGYNRIEVKGNYVDLHNTDIDFGSIAKGYAADKMVSYLKENGAKNGIVNLGGNVAVFGKAAKVGIKRNKSVQHTHPIHRCSQGQIFHLRTRIRIGAVVGLGDEARICLIICPFPIIISDILWDNVGRIPQIFLGYYFFCE